jgi:ComF family protein
VGFRVLLWYFIGEMGLLDLIFPKRCVACGKIGSYLCQQDKRKIKAAATFCPVCLKGAVGGTTHERCKSKLSLDGLVCIFSYAAPIKEIIHELKYRFVKDLLSVVEAEIKNARILQEIDFHTFTLVPIPLSVSRKNWRGFNQAEILGRVLARQLKIPIDSDTLKKIKETKPQAKLPRKERLRQARGVFRAVSNISGRNFIVFDDVWTTGATMKAAASALKRKGATKVWGLALASSR